MKKWYAIKHKNDKRWTAYNITAKEVKNLKDGYECKGPFKSVVSAMLAVNSKSEVK